LRHRIGKNRCMAARGGRAPFLTGTWMASSLVLALALLGFAIQAAPAAAAEPCPNEQLRQESLLNPETHLPYSAALPECRAYELVSPPFQDGFAPAAIEAISGDGSRLLVESLGTYAGVGSNLLGAIYALSRGPGGWQAEALNPSAEQFNASKLFAASPDARTTLWALRGSAEPVGAANLYRREPDGAFVKVGSMAPPSAVSGPPAGSFQILDKDYEFAGASADLTHALFYIVGGPYWPGDTTTEQATSRSLYEYVGIGQKVPALVGVSDGATTVDGERLPHGTVISDCSTTLGSAKGRDTYNAVSSDGEVVFFTAEHSGACSHATRPEVDELYARLQGIQTVAISEPTKAQCSACSTSEKKPAIFQGASEDGSKAFFLTEQDLLPGATGLNLYEYNFDAPNGEKVSLVSKGPETSEVQGVLRLSEDGTHLYFVAKGVLTEGSNLEGVAPTAGSDNLYLYQRDGDHPAGQLTFVGSLSEEDAELWEAEDQRRVQTTPDGRFLVFSSFAHLVTGDEATARQVFEYDAAEQELVRISKAQSGYLAGEESADANRSLIRQPNYLARKFLPATADANLAISSDGSTVLFESFAGLVPAAAPAAAHEVRSAYEYHSNGSIRDGELELISDGNARVSEQEQGGLSLVLGPSGTDIYFKALEHLVGQDSDTQFNLYDARTFGGFSAPAFAPGCEVSASCQGAAAQPPLTAGPVTPAFVGPPNPKPVRKKPKKHKKHHRSHRHAHATSRRAK
jgi:hypothetical protein